MGDVINFKDLPAIQADKKQKKAIKKLLEDLEVIIKVMNLSINGLTRYGKFVHVAETLSSIKTNKTLLEISYNKYKRKLDESKT